MVKPWMKEKPNAISGGMIFVVAGKNISSDSSGFKTFIFPWVLGLNPPTKYLDLFLQRLNHNGKTTIWEIFLELFPGIEGANPSK